MYTLQNKDSNLKSRTIRFADDKEDKTESEINDKDKEKEREIEKEKETAKVKPTTLQQKMLAMAGQDIDQFMREMEVVHKKRETERAQDLSARLTLLDADASSRANSNGKSDQDDNLEPPGMMDHPPPHNPHHPQHQHQHSLPPLGLPPPPLLYRPPPPPMHALRMPPPPPPRIGLRLPPGKRHRFQSFRTCVLA